MNSITFPEILIPVAAKKYQVFWFPATLKTCSDLGSSKLNWNKCRNPNNPLPLKSVKGSLPWKPKLTILKIK